MALVDIRARKILLDAFWKSGWKSEDDCSPEMRDIEYARSKGYWFDDIEISHDALVGQIVTLKKTVSAKDVGDAFLASLSSRRLELRSALASYAFISNFPDHRILSGSHYRAPSGAVVCNICGNYDFDTPQSENLNILNFERHKWGGVRRDDPIYAWFDLTEFSKIDHQKPTKEDYTILCKILDIASNMQNDARPISLAKSLAGVLKSNEAERRILIEILSLCGVLHPLNESGYFGEFTFETERRGASEHTNDWGYPARWWRGSDGINPTAVSTYFPKI